ncbi:MAG: hypothetical protein ACR2HR_03355 [Euzebya sp.]
MSTPADVARFIDAVRELEADTAAREVTSIRRSPAVGAALGLAVAAGICESASEFQNETVLASLRQAAHRAALDLHYATYPEDQPSTVDLAEVRVERSGLTDVTRESLEQARRMLVDRLGRQPTVDELVAGAATLMAPA